MLWDVWGLADDEPAAVSEPSNSHSSDNFPGYNLTLTYWCRLWVRMFAELKEQRILRRGFNKSQQCVNRTPDRRWPVNLAKLRPFPPPHTWVSENWSDFSIRTRAPQQCCAALSFSPWTTSAGFRLLAAALSLTAKQTISLCFTASHEPVCQTAELAGWLLHGREQGEKWYKCDKQGRWLSLVFSFHVVTLLLNSVGSSGINKVFRRSAVCSPFPGLSAWLFVCLFCQESCLHAGKPLWKLNPILPYALVENTFWNPPK